MINTIKYTVLELIRIPGIMIWSLVFPIVLMSVFSMMFEPFDEMSDMDPIRIAVVESDDTLDGQAFDEFIEELSSGDSPLLDAEMFASSSEALDAVTESASSDDAFAAYVELKDGKPDLHISNAGSSSDMQDVKASLLIMIMDEYASKSAFVKDMITNDPMAFSNPAILTSVFDRAAVTEQVDVTHNQPKESLRYYFALFGMAALFGGTTSLVAFQRMRPNVSALGARRMVGSLSHGRAVLATLIACWITNFACLIVAYAFMRLIIGIDFGGRDAECLAVMAMSSLTAMALGCAVSAIPKVPEEGKSGILTGIVCFSSLFAGLYGQPTMELADRIAANCPLIEWVNPASQIAQAFYSVMYYDSLSPLFIHLVAMLVMSVVLFALAVGSLRRQRYASI